MVDSVADTSFINALGNRDDQWHEACALVYQRESVIYMPQTVLAEVGYLLGGKLAIERLPNFYGSYQIQNIGFWHWR